jgi:CRP/FNR family transcriptional regulator, cyclic AMP receptor protein
MIQENNYRDLSNHRLFEQLNRDELASLCNISNTKNAKKNDIIFFSEYEIKKIFMIQNGLVKICREDDNGKEMITEVLTRGDVFGHITSNIDNKAEYAKVLSNELILCVFDLNRFNDLLRKNPLLSATYNDVLNEKLTAFQQKYEDLVFKGVDSRILDFFKRYAKHHGILNGHRVEMDMLLTHKDIADYTASSRQSVTTIINQLVGKGKIVYQGRKKVIIPNINNL